MGYVSPINVIYGQMRVEFDGKICKAVQDVGINVDKEELLRALEHDRGQYQKGYADRDREITRCGECRSGVPIMDGEHPLIMCFFKGANPYATHGGCYDPEWYCADGKPRE